MKTIFISHAGPDSTIAKTLAEDIGLSGHDVIIDINDLTPGMNVIEFMNNAIEKADFFIILYSRNTRSAKWQQEESSAALWQEVQNNEKTIIVVRIDDEPLPPLLATKTYLHLSQENTESYKEVLEQLLSSIHENNHTSASGVVSKAFTAATETHFVVSALNTSVIV